MRALVLFAVLLAPAAATAGSRFVTVAAASAREVDGDAAAGQAIADAVRDALGAKLDGCWRRHTFATARVVIEAGAVTAVDLVANEDRRAARCLTRGLRRLRVASAGPRAVVELALEGTTPEAAQLAAEISAASEAEATGDGGGAKGPYTVASPPSRPAPPAPEPARRISVGPADGPAPVRQNVDAILMKRIHGFHACYERVADRSVGGELVVEVAISARGKVTRAEVTSSTVASDTLAGCVVAQVKRARFRPPGEVTTVVVPFRFAPQ